MQAIGRNIIIVEIPEKNMSGGLELSNEDKKDIRYKKGEIISVGNDVTALITVGSEVYYDKVAGFKLMVEDKILTVIRDGDVVVVL